MRAAVLTQFGSALEIKDVPMPEANRDEVLVRVVATGICGTDLKITAGAFSSTPLPIIPGHEVAGELLTDTDGLPAGQRVACYLYDPCGTCRWCLASQFTLCPHSRRIGFERDGGLAEFIVVPRRNVLAFSSQVPFEMAAVAMDAVMAPWRALVSQARVRAGELVVIAGAGGLGLSGVQIVLAMGGRAAVIDPVPSHRDLALRQGAEVAADPTDLAKLRAWAPDGADVGFEASGRQQGFEALVELTRPGGRLVCCGYQPGVDYRVESSHLVLGELTVLGSRAGAREDARAALKAIEEGVIRPLIMERLKLEDANRGLDLLRAGEVLGRLVIVQ